LYPSTLQFSYKCPFELTQTEGIKFAFWQKNGKLGKFVIQHPDVAKKNHYYHTSLKDCVTAWHKSDLIRLNSFQSLQMLKPTIEWVNRCIERHNNRFLSSFLFETFLPLPSAKPLSICFSNKKSPSDQELFFKAVIDRLENNTDVIKLDFSKIDLTPTSVDKLCEAFRKNTTIQTIIFSQPKKSLDLESLDKICQALELHPRLHTLKFSGCDLSQGKIRPICHLIHKNKLITNLHLDKTSISSNEVKLLLMATQKHRQFQKLNLYWNYIEAEGTAYIAEILKTNLDMKVLKIGGNHLELHKSEKNDIGISLLGQAISAHPTLKKISFYWNYLKALEITLLAKSFKENKSISFIDLAAGYIEKDSSSYLALKNSLENQSIYRTIRYAQSPQILEGLVALSFLASPIHLVAYLQQESSLRALRPVYEKSPGILTNFLQNKEL